MKIALLDIISFNAWTMKYSQITTWNVIWIQYFLSIKC